MFVLGAALGIFRLMFQRALKKQLDVLIGANVRKVLLGDTIALANSEMISMQRGIILAAFAKDDAELVSYRRAFKQNVELIQRIARPAIDRSEKVESLGQDSADAKRLT